MVDFPLTFCKSREYVIVDSLFDRDALDAVLDSVLIEPEQVLRPKVEGYEIRFVG